MNNVVAVTVKPQTPVVVNYNNQNAEGTDVSLICSTPSDLSSASGGVIFMWVTPSGNKTLSSQSLTLLRLTFADAGAYSCAVTYRGVASDRSADYTLRGLRTSVPRGVLCQGLILLESQIVML